MLSCLLSLHLAVPCEGCSSLELQPHVVVVNAKCAKTLCFQLEAVWRLIWQVRCRYCRRQLAMQPSAEPWVGPGHKMASTCSSMTSRSGPRAASNSRSFGTALSCISRQGITACCCDCMSSKSLLRVVFHLHYADVANSYCSMHALAYATSLFKAPSEGPQASA